MAGKTGPMSDETRAKISEKQKARWARTKSDEKGKQMEKVRRSKATAVEKNNIVKWKDFLVVFESQMAMVTKACRVFGCTTSDVYRRLAADPEFKKKYEEIRRAKLLEVEDKLFEAINKGDVQAIKFYLQCNGYSPSQKVEAEVKTNSIITIDPFSSKKD